MTKTKEIEKINNFLVNNEKIEFNSKNYEKIEFIYGIAIKEIKHKLEILKEEYKMFYNYDLIDHINERIKSKESISKKMTKKGIDFTYSKMIENINDIAGVRVICPLKKDIYTIRKLITNLPGIKILKEKDYITNPKKSGYSSYHMILEAPVTLSKNSVYVKVEVQIRTIAMDFWASLEHKMKYKNNKDVSKNVSKELVQCAKIVNKLDNKMLLLNS